MFEELAGVSMCNRDPLDDTVEPIYNAHLAMHFIDGFDLLCQTLDQGMTSSVFHFRLFGSSIWAHILIYRLYVLAFGVTPKVFSPC